MRNYRIFKVFFRVSFLFLFILTLAPIGIKGAEEQALNQEDLVNLTRPGVVRIVQHVTGEAVIKPFKLDLDKLTISPSEGNNKTIAVDEYMTGSGFIVSQDGYVLTNSHVALDRDAKLKAIIGVATEKISETPSANLRSGSEGEMENKEYVDKIKDYLIENSEFNFRKELVVLNPSSSKNGVAELIKEGFPAKIISANENFSKDGFDVALIKIDQVNLPALPFADTSSVQGGQTIGIFGFPTTAELNDNNLLEATFTQGVISAIKDSDNLSFKIIQTDAKISEGSSGSPLINSNGKVIGMVTYQTQRDRKDEGDNFAFAIPINVVQEGIQKFDISGGGLKFDLGQYNNQFKSGINLFRDLKCKESLSILNTVKSANEQFNVAKNISPYIEKCEEMIANNQSVDTVWAKNIQGLKSVNPSVFALIAMVILGFSLGLVIFSRRSTHDDAEIEKEIEAIQEDDKKDDARVDRIEDKIAKLDGSKNLEALEKVEEEIEDKIEDLEKIEEKIDEKLEKLEKIEKKLDKLD